MVATHGAVLIYFKLVLLMDCVNIHFLSVFQRQSYDSFAVTG